MVESVVRDALEVRIGIINRGIGSKSTSTTEGARFFQTCGVIVLVRTVEPLVRGVPGVLQSAVIIVAVIPRHGAVGGIATTDVRVLVVHVVEGVRGWLQLRVVGRLLACRIAIRHRFARTPGSISDVGSEAREVLCVLVGPRIVSCRKTGCRHSGQASRSVVVISDLA